MTEYIIARKLDTPEITFSMKRKEFYEEQIKEYEANGTPTMAVDVVDIFLFNEDRELFVQKRSRHKKHNPGLFDKSLGGHVTYGDDVDHTAMVETVQELQVPSIVLKTGNHFVKTYKLLENYLTTVALLMPIDKKIIHIPKIFDGKEVVIANYVHLYAGIYGGRTKTVDKEAVGILEYTLDELAEEIKQFPKQYTDDLKILLEHYNAQLRRVFKLIETTHTK